MKGTVYQLFKHRITIILIVFSSLFWISCSSSLPAEVARIDKLLLMQDSLLNQLASLDYEKMDSFKAQAAEKLAVLKKIEPREDQKTDYLQYITAMGEVQKALKKGIPSSKTMSEQLQESRIQLTNLRHDLQNDLIADSLVEKYIQSETEIMNQLSFKASKTLENLKFKEELFLQISHQADSFINSLSL